jgi:uncharacterized membrane protein
MFGARAGVCRKSWRCAAMRLERCRDLRYPAAPTHDKGPPMLLAPRSATLASLILAFPAAARAQEAAEPEPALLDGYLHLTARGIEAVGIAVIVLGAAAATLYFLWQATRGELAAAYHEYRANLGRAILLGLEFLVAADIIGTVAVDPTLRNLAVLGGIVVIRTFLSFALQVEIEGRLPWRRNEPGGVAARGRPPG